MKLYTGNLRTQEIGKMGIAAEGWGIVDFPWPMWLAGLGNGIEVL